MLIKRIYIILFIAIAIGFCFCTSQNKVQPQFVEDISGYPVSSLSKDGKVIYYTKDGKKVIANVGGVEFNGGRDSLSAYLLQKYVDHSGYNYDEYNVYEHFILLFDENLDIKEVRIINRKHRDNKRSYYDTIFVEALESTRGMWHKTIENKKWYFHIHNQYIY